MDKIRVMIKGQITEFEGRFFIGTAIICPLCRKAYSKSFFPSHLAKRHDASLIEAKVEKLTLDNFM